MQGEKLVSYFWSNIHTYTTQDYKFSKTHRLLLAIEVTDKERDRLLLVKHRHMHNTRPFCKTHLLMLEMEHEGNKRNGLLLVKHTQLF